MSFEEITQHVPQLAILRTLAKQHQRDAQYCAVDTWCKQYKPLFIHLVGFECKHEGLPEHVYGCEAYDISYRTIYDSLPPCGLDGKCGDQCGGM
jgi:hypothetical protein